MVSESFIPISMVFAMRVNSDYGICFSTHALVTSVYLQEIELNLHHHLKMATVKIKITFTFTNFTIVY